MSIFLKHQNGRTAWNGMQAYYDDGRTAWNGMQAYYDNGRTAWNGVQAYYDNGRTAWNGVQAYHDNGRTAWNGVQAYHDNGRTAWNGTIAYNENGILVASNLITQFQNINFEGIDVNELHISSKLALLTKTINKNTYAIGLKIILSETNDIEINKEAKTVTNFINLHNDFRLKIINKDVFLWVFGQIVVSPN
jgi:hypothetical protein